MNIAEINLFLVRSAAIDVTRMVCGELDKLTPAAFWTELRDRLVVYYEKFCSMEAAGVRTQFNDVCTVHEIIMYVAICTRNINYTKLAYTGLYIVCTCLYDSKRVCTCLYMCIHV